MPERFDAGAFRRQLQDAQRRAEQQLRRAVDEANRKTEQQLRRAIDEATRTAGQHNRQVVGDYRPYDSVRGEGRAVAGG